MTLLSPGILVVHLKETMAHKFNASLASMDIRSTKLLAKKMGATTGVCGAKITIQCKYSTVSANHVKNFDKAGIQVNYGEAKITTVTETVNPDGTKSTTTTTETKPVGAGLQDGTTTKTVGSTTTRTTIADLKYEKTFFGRIKPSSFEYDGKRIPAKDLMKEIENSPKLRVAVKRAYNPKYAAFADKINSLWARAKGISKRAANLAGDTDAEKMKSLQKDVNGKKTTGKLPNKGDEKPDGSGPYTQGEIDDMQAALKEAEDAAAEATENGAKSAAEEAAEASAKGLKGAAGLAALKVSGVADFACSIYSTTKAIAIGAKAVRAIQLMKYAMVFLNVADQIKAGVAKPADVSFIGKLLTTETLSDDGKMKAATDSFGYKYAAFGDRGKMTTTSSRFISGGGFAGKLANVTNTINSVLGGNPDKACGLLANPFVQVGSLAVGALMWLGSATPASPIFTTANAAKVAAILAMGAATYFLPGILQDMVAGVLVGEGTVGEATGDAITSGASGMMGTAAGYGGNAPLVASQAVDYDILTNQVAASYEEEDRIAYSPFDATSSSTFMGKIVDWLIPYASKMSSLTGILSSVFSVTTGSLAYAISPNASAYTTTIDEFTMCEDKEYKELGVATDPYCNVRYGITSDVLDDSDTIEVAEYLLGVDTDGGGAIRFIEDDGTPTSVYNGFINNCITREAPLVISKYTYSNSDGRDNDGASECIFNDGHSVSSYDIDSCSPPTPSPKPGESFLTKWVDVNAGSILCDPGDMSDIYHFRYLENAYLYLYYVDYRVENGMDGV